MNIAAFHLCNPVQRSSGAPASSTDSRLAQLPIRRPISHVVGAGGGTIGTGSVRCRPGSTARRGAASLCRSSSQPNDTVEQVSEAEDALPPNVTKLRSSSEFNRALSKNLWFGSLSVIYFKARRCRSCKYFTKKYHRVAANHPQFSFLEVTCDESEEMFNIMQKMEVPAMPHFIIYICGREVARISCNKEEALMEELETVQIPYLEAQAMSDLAGMGN